MRARSRFPSAAALVLFLVCAFPVTGASQSTPNDQPNSANGEQSQPSPQKPVRVQLSQREAQSRLRKRVGPQYPLSALSKRQEGSVKLKAVVDKVGNVIALDVLSGGPPFSDAAIAAVKKWKYRPYLLNGEAVEFEAPVEINFQVQ